MAPTQPLEGCSCFCPAPKSSDTSIPKPQPQLCLMLSMDVKLEPGGSKPALPHFAFLIVKKKKKGQKSSVFPRFHLWTTFWTHLIQLFAFLIFPCPQIKPALLLRSIPVKPNPPEETRLKLQTTPWLCPADETIKKPEIQVITQEISSSAWNWVF